MSMRVKYVPLSMGQAAQIACSLLSGDAQNLPGCDPGQCVLGDPA